MWSYGGAPHAVEPEAAFGVTAPIPGVDAPIGQLSLERVGLDEPARPSLLTLFLILDLDQAPFPNPFRQGCDEVRLRLPRARRGPLRELERAKRHLELLAH